MTISNDPIGADITDEQEEALTAHICAWIKSNEMLAFGPGHLVFGDYNLHCVSWCIEENKNAIIDRLNDGRVVDGKLTGDNYEFLSLVQLAQSLEYLYLLQAWIIEYRRENNERMDQPLRDGWKSEGADESSDR